MFYRFALISSLVCLSACASSKPASCPLRQTVSVGEVCNAFGTPLCRRLIDCNLASNMEYSDCVLTFKTACCSDDPSSKKPQCTKRIDASHKELDQCSTDIMLMSCYAVAHIPDKTVNTLPVSCTTL